MKAPTKLSRLFAGVTMLAVAHAVEAAQDEEVRLNDMAEPYQPELFLPKALCDSQSASDAVAAIAFNDNRFSDVESWQSSPQATEILTQRVCRDGLPNPYEDTVISDALKRLGNRSNAGWLSDAMNPFFMSDPMMYWGSFLYREDSELYSKTESGKIALNPDSLKLIAAGKGAFGSQNTLFERSQSFADVPEFDDIVRTLFEHAPQYYWAPSENPAIQAKQADKSYRPTAQMFLAAARNPRNAYGLLFGYEHYADLPEAQDIVRALMQAEPLVIIANPYTRVPDGLKDSPLIQVDAATLLRLAGDKKKAEYLLHNYKSFSAMPESRDIIARAMESDPAYYIENFQSETNPLSTFYAETGLLPSAQSMLKGISGENAKIFLRRYDAYAHMPEARQIAQVAIDAVPGSFLEQRNSPSYSEVSKTLLNDLTLLPSEKSLMAIARKRDDTSVNSAKAIFEHYKHIAGLPNAKQIAQVAIDTAPCSFIIFSVDKDMDNALKDDLAMRPSVQALMQVARSGNCTAGLIRGYPIYQHMPEAQQIIQAAADAAPEPFWMGVKYGPEVSDEVKRVRPSQESVERLLGKPGGTEKLISEYSQYSDYPRARFIVKEAISRDPGAYFFYAKSGYLHDDLKNKVEFFPDAQALLHAAKNDELRAGKLIWAYKEYRHMPEASKIFKTVLDTHPRAAYEDLRWAFGSNGSKDFLAPDDLVKAPPGKILNPQQAIRIYLLERHPAVVRDIHLSMGYETTGEFLQISWHPAVGSFLLDMAGAKGSRLMAGMAYHENAEAVDRMDPTLRKDILAKFIARMGGDCDSLNENMPRMELMNLFDKQSWFMTHQVVPPSIQGWVLGCLVSFDPSSVFRDLSTGRLDTALMNPEVVQSFRENIRGKALGLMKELTKNGKAEGVRRSRLNLSYETLAGWASDQIVAMIHEQSRGQEMKRELKDGRDMVIKILNNLHDENDAVRFAILKKLKPADHYFLIGADVSTYYTSTFNKIFNALQTALRTDPSFQGKLFASDDQSRNMLSNLVVLSDAFGRLDELLDDFSDEQVLNTNLSIWGNLLKTLYLSDVRPVVTMSSLMRYTRDNRGNAAAIERELLQFFIDERANASKRHGLGDAMGILAALYAPGRDRDEFTAFFDHATSVYGEKIAHNTRTSLSASDLFDADGNSYQRVVFYDDDDGKSSFANFVGTYRGDVSWQYTDHKTFIMFNRNGVHVLANKPATRRQGQEDISAFVKAQGEGAKISVLVHRGHSYHVQDTLSAYLNKDVEFMWLGSCQSASVWSYMAMAPDMRFIYSKNVGSKRVNDPVMKVINDKLAQRTDLDWVRLRQDTLRLAGKKFGGDYIFPDGSSDYAIRMTAKFFEDQDDRIQRLNALAEKAAKALNLPTVSNPAAVPQTSQKPWIPELRPFPPF